MIKGVSLSVIVTLKVQEFVLLLKSVAILVIEVVPTMNTLPDAGFDIIVEMLQLSLAVTLKLTTALQYVGSLVWVISDEQVIAGASLSVTVILKAQEFVLP